MSTKTKHRSAAPPVRPNHVKPRPAPIRQARRQRIPWIPVAIGLALVGVLALFLWDVGSAPRGKVVAATTAHDFGQVPIGGGYLTAKFPLTVNGEALVTDITST
jgi:hypothetical protein